MLGDDPARASATAARPRSRGCGRPASAARRAAGPASGGRRSRRTRARAPRRSSRRRTPGTASRSSAGGGAVATATGRASGRRRGHQAPRSAPSGRRAGSSIVSRDAARDAEERLVRLGLGSSRWRAPGGSARSAPRGPGTATGRSSGREFGHEVVRRCRIGAVGVARSRAVAPRRAAPAPGPGTAGIERPAADRDVRSSGPSADRACRRAVRGATVRRSDVGVSRRRAGPRSTGTRSAIRRPSRSRSVASGVAAGEAGRARQVGPVAEDRRRSSGCTSRRGRPRRRPGRRRRRRGGRRPGSRRRGAPCATIASAADSRSGVVRRGPAPRCRTGRPAAGSSAAGAGRGRRPRPARATSQWTVLTIGSGRNRPPERLDQPLDRLATAADDRLARGVDDQQIGPRPPRERRADRLGRVGDDPGDPVDRLALGEPPGAPGGVAGAGQVGAEQGRGVEPARASRRARSRPASANRAGRLAQAVADRRVGLDPERPEQVG